MAGCLIGFMQYQSRLLAATEVSSGDVILQAELDGRMREELADLRSYESAEEKSSVDFAAGLLEAQFRIKRICNSLKLEGADFNRCTGFLQTVPFNDTTSNQIVAASDANSVIPIAFDQGSVISAMTRILSLSDSQKESVSLHKGEIPKIAELNVKIESELYQRYFIANANLISKCDRLLKLSGGLKTYRNFSVNQCYLRLLTANSAQSAGPPRDQLLPLPANIDVTDNREPVVLNRSPVTLSDAVDGVGETSPSADEPISPGAEGEKAANAPADAFIGDGTNPAASADNSNSSRTASDLLARQRNFELVSQYLFYDKISFGILKSILISPPDFLAFLLTGLCGLLGGLLKIILSASNTGKSPTWRNLWVTTLLGLICAIIFYSLFRGGYLAISNEDPKIAASGLNPFVIAILALASGLLSERAINAFKEKTNIYFGEADAAGDPKYAVGLKAGITDPVVQKTELVRLCNISPEKLDAWIDEREPVPPFDQDLIARYLGMTRRALFTVEPPVMEENKS